MIKLLIAFRDESFMFLTDGRVLAHRGGNAVFLTETHHNDKSFTSLLSDFLSNNYGRSPSQFLCVICYMLYVTCYMLDFIGHMYLYLYLYMCVHVCV